MLIVALTPIFEGDSSSSFRVAEFDSIAQQPDSSVIFGDQRRQAGRYDIDPHWISRRNGNAFRDMSALFDDPVPSII